MSRPGKSSKSFERLIHSKTEHWVKAAGIMAMHTDSMKFISTTSNATLPDGKQNSKNRWVQPMMKVITEGIFHTSMGIILKVKNDREYRVGDIVIAGDKKYKIDRLTYSPNPDYLGYVGLVVTQMDDSHEIIGHSEAWCKGTTQR